MSFSNKKYSRRASDDSGLERRSGRAGIAKSISYEQVRAARLQELSTSQRYDVDQLLRSLAGDYAGKHLGQLAAYDTADQISDSLLALHELMFINMNAQCSAVKHYKRDLYADRCGCLPPALLCSFMQVCQIDDPTVWPFIGLPALYAAETMLASAYHEGVMDGLMAAIGRCKDLLSPLALFPSEDCVLSRMQEYCVTETDICSKQTLGELFEILVLLLDPAISYFLYLSPEKTAIRRPDYISDDLNRRLSAEILPFLTGKQKRNAKKVAARTLGDLYGRYVEFVYDRLGQKPLSEGPDWECLADGIYSISRNVGRQALTGQFAGMARDVEGCFRDWAGGLTRGYAADRAGTIELYPEFARDQVSVFAGIYLLLLEHPCFCFASCFTAFLTLFGPLSRHAMATLHCDLSISSDNLEKVGGRIKDEDIENVLDLFYAGQASGADAAGYGKAVRAEQLMTYAGFTPLCPEDTMPERTEMAAYIRQLAVADSLSEGQLYAFLSLLAYTRIRREIPERAAPVDDRSMLLERAEASAREAAELRDRLKSIEQADNRFSELLRAEQDRVMELERRITGKDDYIKELEQTVKETRSLADELLDVLSSMSSEIEESDDQDGGYQFPASLNGYNVVVYGGHPFFCTALQKLLPEIRLYQSDRRPSPEVLRGADIAFLQPNYMAHSNFYFVNSVCRNAGVPHFSFVKSGAKACAVQILDQLAALSEKKPCGGP